jgi:hypothetical protein
MTHARKIHFDYAGADGLPKPMTWFLAAQGCGTPELERRARKLFAELFPEWRLRRCEAEDADVATDGLIPVPGVAGVWVAHLSEAAMSATPHRISAPR